MLRGKENQYISSISPLATESIKCESKQMEHYYDRRRGGGVDVSPKGASVGEKLLLTGYETGRRRCLLRPSVAGLWSRHP